MELCLLLVGDNHSSTEPRLGQSLVLYSVQKLQDQPPGTPIGHCISMDGVLCSLFALQLTSSPLFLVLFFSFSFFFYFFFSFYCILSLFFFSLSLYVTFLEISVWIIG